MTPEKRKLAEKLAKDIFAIVSPYVDDFTEQVVKSAINYRILQEFKKLIVVDKEEFKKNIKVTQRDYKDKYSVEQKEYIDYVEYKVSLTTIQKLEKCMVDRFPVGYVENEIKEMFTYCIEDPQLIDK